MIFAVLLGLSAANASDSASASDLANLLPEDNNQLAVNQGLPTFIDVVNSKAPMALAMEYMTVCEIQKLASLDPRIFLLANETRPKVSEVAEGFRMPALKKLKEHPDLAYLEGYTFTDSMEDSIKKVELLVQICNLSLRDSPVFATIQEALIDEVIAWTDEYMDRVFPNIATYVKFDQFGRIFFGHEKYESAWFPYFTRQSMRTMGYSEEQLKAEFNRARYDHFEYRKDNVRKMIIQYLKGKSTLEKLVSKLPLPKFKRICLNEVAKAVFDIGIIEEYSDEELIKILDLMDRIEQTPVSEDLSASYSEWEYTSDSVRTYCEFLLGKKRPEDVSAVLAATSSNDIITAFFIAFLRENLFQEAANILPNYIGSEKAKRLISANDRFLKYLYKTDKRKLNRVSQIAGLVIGYNGKCLYVMMACGDPVAKALLELDDSSLDEIGYDSEEPFFQGVCEEDLQAIYNNEKINPPFYSSISRTILVEAAIQLCKIRLKTPEGREWILSQFENNYYMKSQLESCKICQLIYNMAKIGDSIKKYLFRNSCDINSDAVIRDLEDPIAFAENKAALSDLFSLLPYIELKSEEFPLNVFENLNCGRLQRILELPGVYFDQIYQMAGQAKSSTQTIEIMVIEMLNREPLEAVLKKMNLPFPLTSNELDERILNVLKFHKMNSYEKSDLLYFLKHMNDYRKTVFLITSIRYNETKPKYGPIF